MDKTKLSLLSVFCILFGAIIFSISCYKANRLAFTHDEAFTYNNYVSMSIHDIVTYAIPVSANNHIVNTIGMKAAEFLFGSNKLVLRIPNLMGHLLFLIFSFLLASKLNSKLLFLSCFIILNTNYYLNDFFSLARGYGISNGLLMAHFYFLHRFLFSSKSWVNYLLAFLLLIGAIYGNLTLIYYLLSLIIIFFIYQVEKKEFLNFRSYLRNRFLLISIVILALLGYCLNYQITELQEWEQLYLGGTAGFFQDTVVSLVWKSTENAFYSNYTYATLKYFFSALVILCVFISISLLLKKKVTQTFGSVIITAFSLIILTEIMNAMLSENGKYLIERTAVFLIPFFFIGLFFVIDNNRSMRYMGLITFLFSVVFTFHFFKFVSLQKTIDWAYDADNENIISDLMEQRSLAVLPDKTKLGIDWIYAPSLNFYINTTGKKKHIEPVDKDGYDNRKFDYYVCQGHNVFFSDTNTFKLLKYYQISDSYLYKFKNDTPQ